MGRHTRRYLIVGLAFLVISDGSWAGAGQYRCSRRPLLWRPFLRAQVEQAQAANARAQAAQADAEEALGAAESMREEAAAARADAEMILKQVKAEAAKANAARADTEKIAQQIRDQIAKAEAARAAAEEAAQIAREETAKLQALLARARKVRERPVEVVRLPNGWVIHEPVNLGPTVNSSFPDGSPALSADGLTLLFDSSRPGGQGDSDLWMCTRASLGKPFGKLVNLGATVNSSLKDAGPALSVDGLTLLLNSNRPGGQGGDDLWMCMRASAGEPFGRPVNLGPTVNSNFNDLIPALSADGLTLLFRSNRPPGGPKRGDLWMCTRASPTEPFGKLVNLGPTVNSSFEDTGPALSADGLTLLFNSNRPGGQGHRDLWMCTRESAGESFGRPVSLGPTVNSSANDGAPALSVDGRTIVFYSDRPGGQGDMDLWMARIEQREMPSTEKVSRSIVDAPIEPAPPGTPEAKVITSPLGFVKHTLDSSFARAAHVDAVDLDGDGDVDILASTNSGGAGTTWWENDGAGNFAEHPIAEGWALRPRDRDGDGDLDLAGHSDKTDETAWWANDGRGNFTRHELPDRLHLRPTIDADSDGDLDYIGYEKEEGGIVAWWENKGKDTFVKHVLDREFRSPWWAGTVDMDRDGDADLLACAAGANQIAWWETRSEGVFVKHVVDDSFRGVKRLYPIDIDQDGDLDIAGAAWGAGHVAWFENDGSQSFTKHLIDTNLYLAHSVCALDMDTDGDVDVVACGINAPRHVVWYENDGQQSFSSHTVDSSFTSAWRVAAADFDGDGDGDIVAASFYRNEVAWWQSVSNR